MAAKNESGELTPVPGLIIEDETQMRRFCEGKLLRRFSAEKRNMLKSDLSNMSRAEVKQMCEGEKCELYL
jgi:hypothetical protein